MAISEIDIKLLWGRASGRCSAPGCHVDLTPLLEKSGDIVLGEMAHVIGRKPGAARSNKKVGADDTYANLILLCPTHHTTVDKAPKDFPVSLLRRWKKNWEKHVGGVVKSVVSRPELFRELSRRLAENHKVHSEWGPTSERAQKFPHSDQAASFWQLRRLAVIVPNNRAMVALLKRHEKLFAPTEWESVVAFIEHAQFFDEHCAEPKDATAYLPFPDEFAELVSKEAIDG